MQTMTAKEAQTRFGQFSREAQRDSVLVTSHGQPVFLAIPVRITATIAKMISEVSLPSENGSQNMRKFLADLEARRAPNPNFTEDEINDLIKASND